MNQFIQIILQLLLILIFYSYYCIMSISFMSHENTTLVISVFNSKDNDNEQSQSTALLSSETWTWTDIWLCSWKNTINPDNICQPGLLKLSEIFTENDFLWKSLLYSNSLSKSHCTQRSCEMSRMQDARWLVSMSRQHNPDRLWWSICIPLEHLRYMGPRFKLQHYIHPKQNSNISTMKNNN